MPLQIFAPSSRLTKVTRVLHYGDPKLYEEIVIPNYDSKTISIDQIIEMQEALNRRKREEILKKEYKQKQALHEIKDIFLDAFSLQKPNETKPIMEQLSKIVEQVTNEDQETNVKLMKWSEKKFQWKVNEKISSDITLSQVELLKKIEKVKTVLENVFSLYKKLYDFSYFTQETGQRILSLERNLKISSMQLPKDLTQSEKHFVQTLHTQKELVAITTEEANIKAKLM